MEDAELKETKPYDKLVFQVWEIVRTSVSSLSMERSVPTELTANMNMM